jgi:FkbM family methyltransferase
MGKQVIAFEPMERNLRYLCKNINANGWEGAEVFPIALSNKVGILEIYGANTGASLVKGWAGVPENYKTLVPCSTMDLLLNTRLLEKRALVLVDIEGAESWMLEGATKMLTNSPSPIWVVEITSKELQPNGVDMNPNFKSTFELFIKHGYEAFDIEQEMRPMTMEYIEQIVLGSVKFDSNNFMFRRP